jgi:hypothetical protein
MEEVRSDGRPGLTEGLAGSQVSIVSENDAAIFAVNREGTLACRMGQPIERGIEAGSDQEQAGDQKGGDFQKSFHRFGCLDRITMTENPSRG